MPRNIALIIAALLSITTAHAKDPLMPPEPTADAPASTGPDAPAITSAPPTEGAAAQPDTGGYADHATRMAQMHEAAAALESSAETPVADVAATPEPAATPDAPSTPEPPVEPAAPGLEALRQDVQRLGQENAELRQLVQQLRTPAQPEGEAPATERPDPMDIDGHFTLVAAQHLGEHAGEYLTGRYAEALQVVSDWRGFDRDGVDEKTRSMAQRHIGQAKLELRRIQDESARLERLARLEKRQEELEKRPEQAKREQFVADAKTAALEYLQDESFPYPAIRAALSDKLTPEELLAPVDFSTIHDDDSWTHDTDNPLDKHLQYVERLLAAGPAPASEAGTPAPAPPPTQAPGLVHNPGALAIPPGGTTPSEQAPAYTDNDARLAKMRAAAARLPRA